MRSRFTTPPRDLVPPEGQTPPQLTTPMRSAIFAVFYYCEQRKVPCNLRDLHDVFGYSSSTAFDVLKSKRCRRLQHTDGPDPRGRRKAPVTTEGHASDHQIDSQVTIPHEASFMIKPNPVDPSQVLSPSNSIDPPQVPSQSDTLGPPQVLSQSDMFSPSQLSSQSDRAKPPNDPGAITTIPVPQRNKRQTLTPRKTGGKSKVLKPSSNRKPKNAVVIPNQRGISKTGAPPASLGGEDQTNGQTQTFS